MRTVSVLLITLSEYDHDNRVGVRAPRSPGRNGYAVLFRREWTDKDGFMVKLGAA